MMTRRGGDPNQLPEWAEELRALGKGDDVALEALAKAFGEWARAVALKPEERRGLWDRIQQRGADSDGSAAESA
jgi:hypothetical protein